MHDACEGYTLTGQHTESRARFHHRLTTDGSRNHVFTHSAEAHGSQTEAPMETTLNFYLPGKRLLDTYP